jgi:hypothetical protein
VAGVVLVAILAAAARAGAAWPSVPPPLPPPAGRVVRVSTEAALQAAVSGIASNTTIVIAAGTYRLSHTLALSGPLSNVGIRGATGNRDDVVLAGPGRDRDNPAVPHGIWVAGDVRGLTIANLTIRDVPYHPICINPGPRSPRIYNVRLVNGGQQLLKVNPNADGTGVDDGAVEYSLLEYEPASRDAYANAIDIHAGARWTIRNNLIRDVRAPSGQFAGPAVLVWNHASDTIVEANTFVNCQREIAFGLIERPLHDHSGGIVRDNFIYRDRSVEGGDVAIGVSDSPGTRVLHNSILIDSNYPNAIEYRFRGTSGVLIANNLANRAVAERDGASGTVRGNLTTATAAFFVDAAAGDLHLTALAAGALGTGEPFADAGLDWDGEARRPGTVDLGADQTSARRDPRHTGAPAGAFASTRHLRQPYGLDVRQRAGSHPRAQ